MSTTKVDLAMDKFMEIHEIYHMNSEELDELSQRVNKRIDSFYMGAKATEADRMQEYEDDMKEEPTEVEEE